MTIRTVGAEVFHTDGWTDRPDELTVAFRSLANATKITISLNIHDINLKIPWANVLLSIRKVTLQCRPKHSDLSDCFVTTDFRNTLPSGVIIHPNILRVTHQVNHQVHLLTQILLLCL